MVTTDDYHHSPQHGGRSIFTAYDTAKWVGPMIKCVSKYVVTWV